MNSDACPQTSEVVCSPGYGGNLCQTCTAYNDSYYYQATPHVCDKCMEKTKNSLAILGISAMMLAYLTLLILITIFYS